MKHARDDDSRIQDPAGLIPADEPVFLIRGQDLAGPATLREWCHLARDHGASDAIIDKVLAQARAMEEWQRSVARKVPDLPTEGALP